MIAENHSGKDEFSRWYLWISPKISSRRLSGIWKGNALCFNEHPNNVKNTVCFAYYFKAFGAFEKYCKNQLSGTRTNVVSFVKAVPYACRLLMKA